MNRRSFLETMIKACVAPMFLPGAGRLWVPNKKLVCAPNDFDVLICNCHKKPLNYCPMWIKINEELALAA